MPINIFLVPLIIIVGFLLSQKDNRDTRKLYIVICIAVLNFIAAMRSPEWMTDQYGIDSTNYKEYFEEYHEKDWNGMLIDVYLRYFGGEGDGDIGFVIINKIISLFTNSFYVYSLIVNLIFFIPFGKILYRYSTNIYQIMFAFVFFIAMIMVFFYAGARQIFAVGFDMMALIGLLDRKIKKTLVIYAIGISIHFSSILFIIPLVMIWLDVKPNMLKKVHLICLMLFPVVLLFSNQLISYMGNFIGMDKYAKYGDDAAQGGTSTFIIIIELLSLFLFVSIKRMDLIRNETLRNFYVMVPLFTFFAPLIYTNGSMIRISLYFYLFIFLLMPYSIECMFKQKDCKLPYSVAIGVLALYAIYTGYDYYFFWQIAAN